MFNSLNCEIYCQGIYWNQLLLMGVLALNAKTSLEMKKKKVSELPLAEIRTNVPGKVNSCIKTLVSHFTEYLLITIARKWILS